jgi:hypothetical protein
MNVEIDSKTLAYIKQHGSAVTVQGPRPAVG